MSTDLQKIREENERLMKRIAASEKENDRLETDVKMSIHVIESGEDDD